jgi:hypothetical protein
MARTQRKERDGLLGRDGHDAASSHRAHADVGLVRALWCRAVAASAGGEALGSEVTRRTVACGRDEAGHGFPCFARDRCQAPG